MKQVLDREYPSLFQAIRRADRQSDLRGAHFELAPQILGREDQDASGILQSAFQREGIDLLVGVKILAVERLGAALAAAPPAPKGAGVDLMALIDEELVDEPKARPVPTRVEVNVSLVSEHNFYVGQTRRMDSGGVFIATAMPPPVGTRLEVRLGLADGRKLDLEGEVAFVREKSATIGRQPTGCGVRLHGMPGWAVDAIERFILARQPIVYTPL